VGIAIILRTPAFHLADDRVERTVRVLRGAEIAQARVRLGGETFQERGREPRFPDTASPESNTTWPSPIFARDQRRRSNSDSFPARRGRSGWSCEVRQSGCRMHASCGVAPSRLLGPDRVRVGVGQQEYLMARMRAPNCRHTRHYTKQFAPKCGPVKTF
jgi:hypothetical protein